MTDIVIDIGVEYIYKSIIKAFSAPLEGDWVIKVELIPPVQSRSVALGPRQLVGVQITL